jgi:ssDNA-binding Zn-finger/Zn-ribbon topoisomerase 1
MPVPKEITLPLCPLCGGKTVLRDGRNGPFYSCAKYPECKGTVSARGKMPNKKASADERRSASTALAAAFDLIEAVGGTAKARLWLNIANRIILGEDE